MITPDGPTLAAALTPRHRKPLRWAWRPAIALALPPPKILHATWEGGGPPFDLVGRNHGAFPSTPPAWAVRSPGLALSYDEVDDFYTIPDGPDLTFPVNWTLAFYMRLPDNTGSFFQYFLSWGGFNVNPNINLFFAEDSEVNLPGGIKAAMNDGAGNRLDPVSADGIAPFSDYKLIVLRKFAANEARWYVDGVQSHQRYDNQSSVGAINRTDSLEIGRRVDGNTARYFGGEISWWAKWDLDIGEGAIAALAADPFALIRPSIERVMVSVPAGGIVVTPSVSASAAAKVDPSVILGSLTIPPGSAGVIGAKADPTAVLGSLSLTPGAATARAQNIDPTVQAGGDVTVTPVAREATAAGIAPGVVLGSITVSAIASAGADTVDPGFPSIPGVGGRKGALKRAGGKRQ